MLLEFINPQIKEQYLFVNNMAQPRDENFYKRLGRLFSSGPALRRKIKGKDPKNFYDNSVVHSNLGYYGGSAFKRENSPFSIQGAYGLLNRMTRYQEFSSMEQTAEVNTALDVISHEVCSGDEHGKSFHVFSDNPQIQKALEELFNDVYNIEFEAIRDIRNLIKNGDFFRYIEVAPGEGVVNVEPIPVNEVEREDGYNPNDPYAVRFKLLSRGGKYLENWQMLHFRILGNDEFLPYGQSILESAVRPHRQLCYRTGTQVWVKDHGYKEIQNVQKNDTVYSFDTNESSLIETQVKHNISMGKQKLVRVFTTHRQIDVTPNHGMLVFDKSGAYHYKQAKDLIIAKSTSKNEYELADKLILPAINFPNNSLKIIELDPETYSVKLQKKTKYIALGIVKVLKDLNLSCKYKNAHGFLNAKRKISFSDYKKLRHVITEKNTNVDFYQKQSKNKSFLNDFKFDITDDFVKFFGFMLGDGWVNEHKFGFALGIYEEMNQYYLGLIKKIFPNIKYRISIPSIGRGGQVNFDSTEICDIFRKAGFITGFAKKRVPEWIYSLPQASRIGFVQGIYDADGSRKGKTLSLSNKGLIEDVKILCQQSGVNVGKSSVIGHVEGYYPAFNKIIKRQTSYRLLVDLKYINTNSFSLEAVTGIKEIEEDETYDLEVDHPTHNFIANGVVGHNSMLEDAMLIYRIVRAPERRAFYIDVSGMNPNDIPQYMEAIKETIKGNSVMDRLTGRQDHRYNALSIEDDIFLPTKTNSLTKIDSLPGGTNAAAVEDVEYMRNKLIAALKVPKAYISYSEGTGSKATLSQLDIRFSRTISVLQKIMVAEFNKLAIIHLYAKGFTGESLLDFELKFSNPSTVALQQKLALVGSKIDIATKAWELSKETGLMDMEYIQKEILGFRMEQIVKMRIGAQQDQIRVAQLRQLAEAAPKEDKDGEAIIDPFDPENYNKIPAASMPQQLQASSNDAVQQRTKIKIPEPSSDSLLSKVMKTNKLPISANPNPNIQRLRRQTRRSKEFTGRGALVSPDINQINSANNRQTKDPYDYEYIKNQINEELFADDLNESKKIIPLGVPRDVASALRRFDEVTRKSKEVIDLDILSDSRILDDSDDEMLLLEDQLFEDS